MKEKASPERLPVGEGGYTELIGGLTELLEEACHAAARSVNAVFTAPYIAMEREGQVWPV